jgi:hypothetical protein
LFEFWLFLGFGTLQLEDLTLCSLSPNIYAALFCGTLSRLAIADLEERLDPSIWATTLKDLPLFEEVILRYVIEEIFYESASGSHFDIPHLRRVELADNYADVPGLANIVQAITSPAECILISKGGAKWRGSYMAEAYYLVFYALSTVMIRETEGVEQIPRTRILKISDYRFSIQTWVAEVNISLYIH